MLELPEFADFFGLDIFLFQAMPDDVLDVERIAVGRLEDFTLIEIGLKDMNRVVLDEVPYQLRAYCLRQRSEFDHAE